MKISSLIVSLILVSLMVFAMSSYILNVGDNYSVTVDNTSLSSYDKMEELSVLANQTKGEVNDVSTDDNILDRLSAYVVSTYTAFKTLGASADVAFDITQQGTEDLQLPAIYNQGLQTILIIIIFVGIIIAAIFKWRV